MKQCYKTPAKEVSYRMKRIRSSHTSIEKKMKTLLHKLNIKYEDQPKLFGHPDFKIVGTDILIFCDSSFWHGRREKEVSGEAFKRNRKFWTNKLIENKKRDKRINIKLRNEGWSVHRFWDTDILKNEEKVQKRLRRIIDAKIK